MPASGGMSIAAAPGPQLGPARPPGCSALPRRRVWAGGCQGPSPAPPRAKVDPRCALGQLPPLWPPRVPQVSLRTLSLSRYPYWTQCGPLRQASVSLLMAKTRRLGCFRLLPWASNFIQREFVLLTWFCTSAFFVLRHRLPNLDPLCFPDLPPPRSSVRSP